VIDIDLFKEWYAETFGSAKNQILSATDQKRLAAVVEYLSQAAREDIVGTVEVTGSHVAITTVEAYGLEIGVDAVGNAVTVGSPHGFHMDLQ